MIKGMRLGSGTAVALAAILLVAPPGASAQGPELDTPYVPTPQVVVDRMLDLARVKRSDVLIDLGSGDGRMVITAAQKYGARGSRTYSRPISTRRTF